MHFVSYIGSMKPKSSLYVSNEMLYEAMGDEKTMKGYIDLMVKNLMFVFKWPPKVSDSLNEIRATSSEFAMSKLSDYNRTKHGLLFTFISSKLKYNMFREYNRMMAL